MPCCSAWRCSNRPGQGVLMHRFPTDPQRRKMWEIRVKRENWSPNKSSFLCQEHFDPSQYELARADGLQKLRPDALPTLFAHNGNQAKVPRKRPRKRGSKDAVLDAVVNSAKRIRLEHSYASSDPHVLQTASAVPNESSGEESTVLGEVDMNLPQLIAGPACFNKECGVKLQVVTEKMVKLRAALSKEKREKRKLQAEKKMMNEKLQKVFTNDQMEKMHHRSTRGVKWCCSSVKKALQLKFACGTTGYELLLEQGQPLPSLRTLRRKMEVVSMEPGILEEVFKYLELKVPAMKPEERECCLTLDEMAIQAGVQYDQGASCMRGDVTLPGHHGEATHALVFMLGGITTRWKQTVGYHFTGNSVDGRVFKPIVMDIIQKAKDIGLHVNSVTSDMGSANRALWASFGVVCSRQAQTVCKVPHPVDPGRDLYFIADVPHVIKNLKSALVNGQDINLSSELVKKYDLPSSKVTVKHIQALIASEQDRDLKLAPNLSDSTLTPSHFDKMKVSQALNFFSHSTSSALRYLVECEGYPKEFVTTAWFFDRINKWFDLMSSRHPIMALSRANPEAYQSALSHLEATIAIFKSISIGSKGVWKPVQTGVILSTTSILGLQSELLDKGHAFLLTSRLTQDCLENLFSSIRSKNPVPTALEFRQALKIITVAQYLKCPSKGSYQQDDREYLAEFLNQPTKQTENEEQSFEPIDIPSQRLPQSELSSLHHVAGYCLNKVKKKKKLCSECINAVEVNSPVSGPIHKLTTLKEYKPGSLVLCSKETIKLFEKSEQIFRAYQPQLCKDVKLKNKLVNIADEATQDCTLPSCHNVKMSLLSCFFGVRLYFFARKHDKIRRKKNVKSSSGGQLGSKSMAMRAAVRTLK